CWTLAGGPRSATPRMGSDHAAPRQERRKPGVRIRRLTRALGHRPRHLVRAHNHGNHRVILARLPRDAVGAALQRLRDARAGLAVLPLTLDPRDGRRLSRPAAINHIELLRLELLADPVRR